MGVVDVKIAGKVPAVQTALRTSALGLSLGVRRAARALYEAGIADAGAVLQGEVNAAGWVDIGAAFSAAVFSCLLVWLSHGVSRIPQCLFKHSLGRERLLMF